MAGKESRKFKLVVICAFFLILLGMALITLAFSIAAVNNNAETSIEQYKELVRASIEDELDGFARLLRNPGIEEILAVGTGNDRRALALALYKMLEIAMAEPYYLVLASGGTVVDSKLPEEIGKAIPEDIDIRGSKVIEDFRGKTGTLVMAGAPLSENLDVGVVVDITSEVENANKPFDRQKSNVLWVSLFIFLGFLTLAVMASLIVISGANRRYISGPINDLVDKANRMMGGETSLQIDVDEKSDYYALQALLDSMQRVLDRLEDRDER